MLLSFCAPGPTATDREIKSSLHSRVMVSALVAALAAAAPLSAQLVTTYILRPSVATLSGALPLKRAREEAERLPVTIRLDPFEVLALNVRTR